MTWHYAAGGQQLGPVDDAELDRLIAAGVITADTLVWRQGLAGWQPLREARAGALVAAAAVQQASAAPAAAPRPRPDPDAEFRRSADRKLAPVSAISRGISLVTADPMSTVGVSALIILMMIGAGFVPCVGSLLQLAVMGPLTAAWYGYFLKRIRGLPAALEDVFAVFQHPDLGHMVLAHVIVSVIGILVMVPMIFAIVFTTIGTAAAAAATESEAAPLFLFPIIALVSLPLIAAWFYLTVAFMFAPALILDRGHAFWPAMRLSQKVVNRNLLPMIGLVLLSWLIGLAGLLALCVGIFVAAPIIVASYAHAYEDLFGDDRQARA